MNKFYELAKSKGWHDNDELGPDGTPSARQRLAYVALILTELAEAIESWQCVTDPAWEVQANGKPIGLLSEVVDIWIRCADTLGACGVNFEASECHHPFGSPQFVTAVSSLLGTAAENCRTGDHPGYARRLLAVMAHCERYGDGLSGIRFFDALEVKHSHNEGRSYRHGGKLA